MMGNLLAMAAQLIPLQTISLKRYTGRTINDTGREVSAFAAAVSIQASVQPVSRSVYEQFGLDFQKDYITVFSTSLITDVGRDVAPDAITYDGKEYQMLSNQGAWMAYNGWNYLLAVRIDR